MSGARVALAALVALSVSLTLLPAAWGAPLQPSDLSGAPEGAFRVDLAPVPGGGSMLVAVSGPLETQIYGLGEDGLGPGQLLTVLPLAADEDTALLACPRVAVLESGIALIAYAKAGAVRGAVFNRISGEVVADLAVAPRASQPCAAPNGASFVVSFLERGPAGTFAVVQEITSTGTVEGRSVVGPLSAVSASLVPASPAPLLAVLDSSGVSLFAVADGGVSPLGRATVSATAGALWAREGSLLGLFSTTSGMLRLQAPIDALSGATLWSVAGPSAALELVAVDSADGMLVAAGRTAAGSTVVREDSIGAFSAASLSGLTSAAAATDGFGLARVALLRSMPAGAMVQTLTAGDGDAVAVSLSGPTNLRLGESHVFTASVRAVRSDLTLVGLDVALPPGWAVGAPSIAVALAKGASAAITFTVAAPPGTAAGTYAVTVTPSAVEAPYAPSATMPVTVLGGDALSVIGTTAALDLAPGGSTAVSVTLFNRGAAAVAADVSPSAPPGFVVLPSVQSVTVSPGATAQVTFTVTAAQGSLPVDGATVSLLVLPGDQSGPTIVDIAARIRGVFLPELLVEARDISAAPGAALALPYAVVNAGNIGGLVSIEAVADGLQGATVTGAPPLVFVPAFSRVELPIDLALPSGARAGTAYQVTVSAALESSGFPVGAPQALFGTVLPSLSFAATVDTAGPTLPGQDAHMTLHLANAGNGPVTASLAFLGVQPGFSMRVAEGYAGGIVVGAFGEVELTLIAHVPADALPGARSFSLSVVATPGGILALELPLEVEATHGITLSVVAPPSPLTARGQDSASFDFAVANTGNTPTEARLSFAAALLSLSVVTETGALAPLPAPFSLSPHSSVALRARVAANFAPGENLAATAVTVDSSAGDSASAVVSVQRFTHDLSVVDLSARPLGGEAVAGALHTVSVTLANAGPGSASGAEAVLTGNGVVLGRLPVAPMAPGASRLIQFDVVPTAADTEFAFHLVAPSDGLDRDARNDALAIHYAVTVRPAPGPLLPPGAAPVAASGISILALLALALSEIGKITLISALFVPLYVKLKPEEVLDQYLRGQIHGYIIANPGEHYNAIKDQLGVTNGALAYHLRVLERAELIRPVRDGMYKRFYPVGVKIPKRKRLSPFQAAIVRAVRANPDISQKQMAEVLGVSNQVVNYNVKQLEDANILKVDRSARASKVTLGPDAPPAEEALALPGLPVQAPTP